jgi:hypothetical protein
VADIKALLATTLVFAKCLLVFDVNDGSKDHSISLVDFKRSLVHMDIRLPALAANQVNAWVCNSRALITSHRSIRSLQRLISIAPEAFRFQSIPITF